MTRLKQLTDSEFRSEEEIGGWPLIHINFGTNPETGLPLVAKGVVAIGNIAFGVVSIGAVAFGVVSLAGIGFGIVSLAGLAFGIVALGAVASGNEFALGAVLLSSKYAIGAVASLLLVAPALWVIGRLRKVKAD